MSESEQKVLRLGIPKGSLQDATLELLRKAGWRFSSSSRSYYPAGDDPEIEAMLVRAQEMARYVHQGIFDAGMTGHDWVVESGLSDELTEVCELVYSKASARPCRWVLAVPESSSILTVKDLQGKRVATEVVNITKRWLESHGVEAQVGFSWGATEVKVPHLADAIVEITETGSSLRANRLRIVDEVLVTTTRIVANNRSLEDPWKRAKLETLTTLLEGALRAHNRVGLKMNARREDLDRIRALVPAMRNPTISDLLDPEWVAIETIVDESSVRELIPALKGAGASDFIEYPLNKVIP